MKVASALTMLLALAPAALSEGVIIQWDANADPVSGYRVFAGQVSRSYSIIKDVSLSTNATITNLSDGVWFFAATAYLDTEFGRLESAFSDEISWTNNPSPPAAIRIDQPGAGEISLGIISTLPFVVQRSSDLVLWEDALAGREGFLSVNLQIALDSDKRFYRVLP